MEIVSGRTGKPHVTSQQFRQFIEGTVGQDSYILRSGEKLEPQLASNNSLKIRSGMMCHHGNISSVKIGTYDEVELTNGTQGMKRIDLVVNRYTRNEEDNTEKNEWVVIMGTPAESNPAVPEYIKGNLQNGDLVDDCPVFEVHFDGINIVEVTKKLEIAQTNKDLIDSLNPDFPTIANSYGLQVNHAKIGKLNFMRIAGTLSGALATHTITLPDSYKAGFFVSETSYAANYRYALEKNGAQIKITSASGSIPAKIYLCKWIIYYG